MDNIITLEYLFREWKQLWGTFTCVGWLFREWKQLWDTFTCVWRLICLEGRVSSLNKFNPIQYIVKKKAVTDNTQTDRQPSIELLAAAKNHNCMEGKMANYFTRCKTVIAAFEWFLHAQPWLIVCDWCQYCLLNVHYKSSYSSPWCL